MERSVHGRCGYPRCQRSDQRKDRRRTLAAEHLRSHLRQCGSGWPADHHRRLGPAFDQPGFQRRYCRRYGAHSGSLCC
ncbi:MAG: hypothetical protein J6J83_06675 [Oscillospiraceae bacterium]|nr:hypothetical protein [Oscillospiraceae bacterium]